MAFCYKMRQWYELVARDAGKRRFAVTVIVCRRVISNQVHNEAGENLIEKATWMDHENESNFRSSTHQQPGRDGFWRNASLALSSHMSSSYIRKGHKGRENWVEMQVV